MDGTGQSGSPPFIRTFNQYSWAKALIEKRIKREQPEHLLIHYHQASHL